MTNTVEKLKTTIKESEFKSKVKQLLKEEIMYRLTEGVDNVYNFNFKGRKYSVKFDVNANETKKGIKIQFLPVQGSGPLNAQGKQTLASEMQVVLNQKLAPLGLTVDYDTDVPYADVIGFTLKIGMIAQMIIKSLQQPAPPPAVGPAPVPSAAPPKQPNPVPQTP